MARLYRERRPFLVSWANARFIVSMPAAFDGLRPVSGF